MSRYPGLLMFFGFYFGPMRLTWNCIYPVRGRWNPRLIWEPLMWRDWSISWPTVRKLRYARKLREKAKP